MPMPEMVEIYDVIIDYAKHYKVAKGQAKLYKDIKPSDIDLSKLKISHGPVNYKGPEVETTALVVPKSHVLFR